jgi:PAS domain S-box-containing protein
MSTRRERLPMIMSPKLSGRAHLDDEVDPGFLSRGGEMGALMRAHDWAATPVGRPETWPPSLRTVIRLLLNTRHPMFVFWGDDLTCFYNDAYRASIGPELHPAALGGPGRVVWVEIWDTIGSQIEQVMSGRGATWHENHLVPITRYGRREDVYWTYSFSPIDHEASETGVGGVLVVCTETTAQIVAERQHAERAAISVAERDRLAQMFAQAPSFIAMLSGPEHRFELVNDAYSRLIGYREILGRTVTEALPEASEQGYLDLLNEVFVSGKAFSSQGARYVVAAAPDGQADERYVDFIYQPMKNEEGEVIGVFVEGSDVTNRTLAEVALRELNETLEQRIAAEVAKRNISEQALRQAQKMEAVGQLTGGIAHDFNNLLTGIIGSLELLQARMTQGRLTDMNRYIGAAQGAAERAATLTHRLLAFSRQQTLDPKPTPANPLISEMGELIRRSIGPGIELQAVLAEDLWPAHCDANQLENALLNLCINARDAMPDGGKLTIETMNTTLDGPSAREHDMIRGHYVAISVGDSGTGMPAEVISRAFDPFFTTKPLGQGTGLGLSMIYGFAKQSGGQVQISSRLGEGTTVRLYLPRHLGNAVEPEVRTDLVEEPRAAHGEAVLIVDDEPTVRMLVADVARELGYTVLEAADGPRGLIILSSDVRIDLLVTDLGLPGGMNGKQVADAARALRPNLKVLFVTGYAQNAASGGSHLEAGSEILVKPFGIGILANRIQELIGSV